MRKVKLPNRYLSHPSARVVAVLAFGLIGVTLLSLIYAAASTANVEPEDGAASGSVIAGSDASASGGNYISFGLGAADGVYNDDDPRIVYAGTWTPVTGDSTKYQGDDHYSQTTDSTATFSFSGTQITVYGAKASHHGIAGVSIDNGTEVMADTYSATRADNTQLFRSATLSAGNHSIRIRVTGTKNAASTGTVIALDRFVVGQDTTPPPPPPPPTPPPPPSGGGDPVNNTNGLRVGYLFTDFSYDRPGRASAGAITAIDNLFKAEPWIMATHTYGFGVWSVAPGNWTDLDARVNRIRSDNGIPVLVLCCSPPAYSTDASNIEAKPRTEFFDDLARDYATIAQRYTDIKYFVVWNEMKGFWNNSLNRWDYEGYTNFYNQVYTAIKAVRPDAQIGGPYPPLTNWKDPVPSGAQSSVTGVWGTRDQRGLDVIQYWLNNKVGGQFVTMDGGCDLHSQQGGGYPSGVTAMQANECFKATAAWVRQRTSMPIWWIEFYANPVPIGDENYKRDVFIDAFNKYKAGGGNVAMFWGSECYGGTLSYQFGSMWNCTTGGTFPLFDAVKNGYN